MRPWHSCGRPTGSSSRPGGRIRRAAPTSRSAAMARRANWIRRSAQEAGCSRISGGIAARVDLGTRGRARTTTNAPPAARVYRVTTSPGRSPYRVTASSWPQVNGGLASEESTTGNAGRVVTDPGGNGGNDAAFALVVQPDGRLVAAGASIAVGSLDFDFALARYNTDGTLDATFGTAGQVVTDFGPVFVGSDPSNCALPLADFRGVDVAFALALQADGKLVAAGVSTADFALARYNADGSLDTTFGPCGRVITDFAGDDAAASALVVQPDGKLVAAG